MAKTQRGAEATVKKTNVAPEKSEVKKSTKAKSEKKVGPDKEVVSVELKVPFKRWFVSKGFKPRWRAGMEAFVDTSVPRTVNEWDKIFKAY